MVSGKAEGSTTDGHDTGDGLWRNIIIPKPLNDPYQSIYNTQVGENFWPCLEIVLFPWSMVAIKKIMEIPN